VLVVCLIGPTVALAQQEVRPAPPPPPPAPGPGRAPVSIGRDSDLGCGPRAERLTPGPDYRLGAGDTIEVQMAGRLDVTKHQITVGPDGSINVPPIGAIDLSGLTLFEANERLSRRVRSMFRFVETTMTVLAPRCFEVVVSGDVERPGSIMSPATRRIQDVLLASGGVTSRGSVRRVKFITRSGEREVDLLRFEMTGDVSQNPLVEDGSRLHVPPRGPAATLSGAVRRPGEYELGASASLAELLTLTGGLHPTAAETETRLTRTGDDGRKETFSVDLKRALAPPADVPLRGGDVVFVPANTVLQDVVEVRGAFAGTPDSGKTTTAGKPTIVQRFELSSGERVRDVVTRSGGPAAFADLRLAVIERRSPAGPAQRIPIDMQRLLVEKDETQNVLLQNGDTVFLPVAEDKVYVLGEVKAPGAQDYRPELTVREYLALAGGLGNRAKVHSTFVTFRNGKTFPMAEAPPLEAGAVVTVPEVAVKWWQDYVQIASVIASLISAYTGLFVIFGGRITSSNND
jgi:protein involved in polysaccharide export with SLBB domain